MENPIEMDDLGENPYFWKYPYIYISTMCFVGGHGIMDSAFVIHLASKVAARVKAMSPEEVDLWRWVGFNQRAPPMYVTHQNDTF